MWKTNIALIFSPAWCPFWFQVKRANSWLRKQLKLAPESQICIVIVDFKLWWLLLATYSSSSYFVILMQFFISWNFRHEFTFIWRILIADTLFLINFDHYLIWARFTRIYRKLVVLWLLWCTYCRLVTLVISNCKVGIHRLALS